jgi:hypothetical protein
MKMYVHDWGKCDIQSSNYANLRRGWLIQYVPKLKNWASDQLKENAVGQKNEIAVKFETCIGKCSVRKSAGTLALLTDGFRGFLQENAEIMPEY